MKSGALYIRVSTDKQEELSPDAQKRLLVDYAEKNNILISRDLIFFENGISGKKADKRPQFQKMIGLAKSKEHPIDVILVWKYSRFARNQEESIVYKSLLKKNNVDVISVSEPLIDGPFGSLIERIIEWMDEYYSIRLSGEVIRGMTENALKGGYNSMPPMGYDSVKNGIPTINEEQAEIVRYIYNKYANESVNAVDICRYLNDHGITTKRGGKFERRTLMYILSNPFYIGKIRWNRQDHENHSIRSEEEWIIRDGKHEPIISKELFEKSIERQKRESRTISKRVPSSCRHWLSGTLKCSSCGKSLSHCISRQREKTYSYFQCYSYLKGICKHSHYIPDKKIIPDVISGLKSFLFSDSIDYEIVHNSENDNMRAISISKKLEKLSNKEKRIKAAYIDGIDTLDEYKKNKQLIQDERLSLQSALASINSEPIRTEATDNLMIEKLTDVIRILESSSGDEQKGQALRSVCDKIVYDNVTDSLHFYLTLFMD